MNKTWSDLNKKIQESFKKESTFKDGINTLFDLRNILFETMLHWKDEFNDEMFYAMPFLNVDGYHQKTIAYSLWHIFRIEDIVIQSLIKKEDQIFFLKDYEKHINTPIISTGNELIKTEIIEFSKVLNLDALYNYINEVKENTDHFLKHLTFKDLKIKMRPEDKDHLEALNVVNQHERSHWLIDYWCKKDIKGLILMPLSRHWIMHVEASLRIIDKLKK
jgi:hypothetical protein